MWMGDYPVLPANPLKTGEELHKIVNENKERLLGKACIEKFGVVVPFFPKILSIAKALPLQIHPDKDLAQRLHAQNPSQFTDDNHKPEIAIALGPFEVFAGWKPLPSIQSLFTTFLPLPALLPPNPFQQRNPPLPHLHHPQILRHHHQKNPSIPPPAPCRKIRPARTHPLPPPPPPKPIQQHRPRKPRRSLNHEFPLPLRRRRHLRPCVLPTRLSLREYSRMHGSLIPVSTPARTGTLSIFSARIYVLRHIVLRMCFYLLKRARRGNWDVRVCMRRRWGSLIC